MDAFRVDRSAVFEALFKSIKAVSNTRVTG